jgi:hypothetical protein
MDSSGASDPYLRVTVGKKREIANYKHEHAKQVGKN